MVDNRFNTSFRILQALGLWTLESKDPIKITLYNCYKSFMMVYFFIIFLSVGIDFGLSLNDTRKWTFNLCLTITVVASFSKTCLNLFNMAGINQLRRDLSRDLENESEDNRKVLQEAATEISRMLRTLIILFYILIIFWFLIPLSGVDDIRLPFQMWLPFDSTVSPNYQLIYAFHGTVAVFLVMTVFGTNTSVVGFILRISAEYDILKNEIRRVFLRYQESLPVSDEEAANQLKNIVQLHQKIIQFVERLQRLFRLSLSIQIAGSPILLLNIGLDIILASTGFNMRLILQIQYIFITSADLFLFCIYGSRLITKSEEVANTIFGSDWHLMQPKYRKALAQIIQRTQKPPRIIVGGLYTINLHLYLETLRITYNILAVVRQVSSAT